MIVISANIFLQCKCSLQHPYPVQHHVKMLQHELHLQGLKHHLHDYGNGFDEDTNTWNVTTLANYTNCNASHNEAIVVWVKASWQTHLD